jgi:hypothetical protein
MAILLRPFGFIAPKTKLFGFPVFRFWAYLMKVILSVPDEGYFERTWWRLFWAYLMKFILSIPDEGYFERTWWSLFWAYLVKVILSVNDDGYFEWTWWRLFQKRIICTTFDILHMFFFYFKETRTVFTFILYPFDLTGI